MTLNHRRWHVWVWVILAPLLVTGFVFGLLTRAVPVYETAHSLNHGETSKPGSNPQSREVTP